MGVHHAKLAACLMTLVFSCTWVCRGEVLDTMDEEYIVHDYVETGIQGVSGEDDNSNQLKWPLDRIRTLLGLQASLKAVADAPSPNAEPPSYDNSGGNNNNDNNSIPFLPLGPSLTTPTPPDHEFSSPAFNFNAPYPVYKKRSGNGKVIAVSVVVTAAVTLVAAGLLFYYMQWRFVGNGRAIEEQPRSERGLLNSSVSEGSDFFKGLNASELGTLHEGSDLAYSFNRDKFERVTFPTYLEHNDTIGSPEVQAMRLTKKPTRFPSLECLSDDDSYHSTCETPSTDSKRPSESRLPAWDLPSSHSSPCPSSSSSSPPPSSPVKSTPSQLAAGSFFPPTKQDPPKPPPTPIPFRPLPPPQAVSVRSPPVQFQSTTGLPNSKEAKKPSILARDSQSSIPPLPPHPPPLFSRTGQNSNQSGTQKGVQLFNANGRNENQTPLPKLKPLYWDKVRAPPDRTMVWNRLRSGSFELDEEMIESLFGCNTTNTTNTVKNEATKSSVVHPPAKDQPILDPKKSQNVAILLRALNVTREEVCDALLQGKGLSTELLETLVKMVPTREEEARLKEYNGDISKLGPGERFIKALLDIPYAFQRVDAMLYRANFEEEVVCIQNSLETLELACKELRCSRLFLKLLEAVLKTGNRMNVGTFRGEAQAFKLDALLKLVDIKGIDGKTTLLHFVVLEIIRAEGMQSAERSNGPNGRACTSSSDTKTLEDKEQDYRKLGLQLISGLSNELHNVKKAAGIDSQALISSLSNLSEGFVKICQIRESELQGLRISTETNQNITHGKFHQSMACFLQQAEDKIGQLQKEEERVFSLVKDITEYFHGDCEKEELHPIRIFVIVRDFLAILDNVCKEVSRMKQNFQTSAQKGSSMISTHKSSHSLFPTTLNKKPDGSGNESVSP
ncbi:formin-like protein 8 [Cryptomeria japonica]|uniref:formin-like protein 8 n=1 Tax=Cryptomeria japonica TaxID=3369 RepID=UPI0027D9F2E6|nr:formin-like protein 8 [Cryptomeria japonica]